MRKVKVWLDDVRMPPPEYEVWCTTAEDLIMFLTNHWGKVTLLSLDHDLGEEGGTGYDVMKWIEEQVFIYHLEPTMEFQVHSANPVGIKNMKAAIDSIERHKEKYKNG